MSLFCFVMNIYFLSHLKNGRCVFGELPCLDLRNSSTTLWNIKIDIVSTATTSTLFNATTIGLVSPPELRSDFPNLGRFQYQQFCIDAGIFALSNKIDESALPNAGEPFPLPHCHPCTREQVLQNIKAWISKSDSETDLLLFSGNLGTGKSAVMQSIMNELLGKDPDSHPIVASYYSDMKKVPWGVIYFPLSPSCLQLMLSSFVNPSIASSNPSVAYPSH